MAGKCAWAGLILLVVLLLPVFTPLAGAQSESTVTRSQTFTVTIAGTPNTPYYVWLKGTFSLSGEPGDQPPIIESYQGNVVQDPPDGPYAIGSYHYYGGGGRTILDDVAPSSSTVSKTSYYAQVTTDANGIGIVAFQTSHATAAQSFSVVAQNPAASGQEVSVALGVPTQVPTPVATLPTPGVIPATLPTTPVTATPVPAVNSTPMATPVKTPPTETPLSSVIVIAAAGTVVLVLGRNRG
ncbi:MAG: hypothetical protein ABSG28_10150 [Methanoregula sp.]|jgi:hypothetical protein|uniref:hypothetical protein n=1 Tax=Methanoregula sp. TaxID=2052170 RepID=UPI003C2A4808